MQAHSVPASYQPASSPGEGAGRAGGSLEPILLGSPSGQLLVCQVFPCYESEKLSQPGGYLKARCFKGFFNSPALILMAVLGTSTLKP